MSFMQIMLNLHTVFVSVDRIEVSNYLLDHRVLFGFFSFSAKINDYVILTSA